MLTLRKVNQLLARKFSKERWKRVRDSIKVYELSTELWYGKYRGVSLAKVIETDRHYVRWMINEKGVELSNEAYAYLERITDDLS